MDSTAGQQSSKAAEQQLFIDKFQELLSLARNPDISLTTVYKEMPITYPATICQIWGHRIELQTCALQLAAISHCKEVYIQSPLVAAPILGRLDRIDISRQTVHLANFCYQELHAKNRSTVRVRFKNPVSIIAHAGPNKISGVIDDISLGGCCINTQVRQGLENVDKLQISLKLTEESTRQGLSLLIPSCMIRIAGDEPPFMCALRFNHTPQSEQLLSIYIYQRQLEILKELRESL